MSEYALQNVFTHVASSYANLWEQKSVFFTKEIGITGVEHYCEATYKRTQQLPTLLRQQCHVLLQPCCSSVQADATTPNNMQQGVQADAIRSIQQCWELLANNG